MCADENWGRPRALRFTSSAAIAAGALLAAAAGFVAGRAYEIPFSTEFWMKFAQPLATFGAGVFALLAGGAALLGQHLSSRRVQRATMIDIQHRDRVGNVEQLWKRFEWVVTQSNPTGQGQIDSRQAAEMLSSIREAAGSDVSQDDQLRSMLTAYMAEQYTGVATEIGLEE